MKIFCLKGSRGFRAALSHFVIELSAHIIFPALFFAGNIALTNLGLFEVDVNTHVLLRATEVILSRDFTKEWIHLVVKDCLGGILCSSCSTRSAFSIDTDCVPFPGGRLHLHINSILADGKL